MADTAGPALVGLAVLDGADLCFPRPAIELTRDVPGLVSPPGSGRPRRPPSPDPATSWP